MYETIKELEAKGLFKKAIDQGLISITVAGQKMIYEIYLQLRKEGFEKGYGKSKAVLLASIQTDTDERSIWEIIKKMED